MDELPYWRVLMRRERYGSPNLDTRIHRMGIEHADAVAEMRALLREVETVSNRDFEMATRKRTQSYRGRKDSALALYYLWRIGEVMTYHRRNFERVYALAERVAPAHLLYDGDDAAAERHLVLKEVSFARRHRSCAGSGEPLQSKKPDPAMISAAGRKVASATLAPLRC